MTGEGIGNGSQPGGPTDTVRVLQSELADARAEIGRLELQLHVLTTVDTLTGLANRNGVLDSIEGAVARHQRMEEPFAVVGFRFPELVGLARVHDPDEYAETMRHLAAMLAAGLRNVDTVGRTDEDAFATVLANIVATDIPIVVDRTLAAIAAAPVRIRGRDHELSPTVAATIPGATPPDAAAHLAALDRSLATAPGAFTIETLG